MKINKIIIAGYELSGLGGMETVCSTLVRLLRARHPGVDISFVFFKEGNATVCDDWLAHSHHRRITSGIKNTKIRRLSFANSFRKIISQEKPELIIALDTLSCFISNVARKYTLHKPVIFSWLHFSTHNLYKAKYVKRADYHLAICAEIAEQLTAMGIEDGRISTIYNPIARSPVSIPRPQEGTRFIYVGRIIADGQKNMRGLFDALAQTKGAWTLDIIGAGADTEMLQEYAKAVGIEDRLCWHGWQKNPWSYIRDTLQTTTCLLSSSHFEGFCMVLAEASAHGVYAISSNCKTGPADIIKEGVNGNLYPTDRPDVFVERLQEVVNGKTLPDANIIKQAIEPFYEDNYTLEVLRAFARAGLTFTEE
ncbi:TPA: glycosyltransferase [Enterobacter chengduensis]|nr:glycosyltransferase [Enterobacter chengduensis]